MTNRWYTLGDATTLPPMGLGTYRLRGSSGRDAALSAIAAGYRLVDSAESYDNEGAMGAAVRECGVPRSELRIATKIRGRHQHAASARHTVEESLFRTGLDYLDLVLVHWPLPRQGTYSECFGALLQAKEDGLVRSVGVSNFLPEHLDRLIADHGVAPSVNQVELHPLLPQEAQVAADAARGVRTLAWSPIMRGGELFTRPELTTIAQAHGATPGQVVLAWEIARGVVPIPKSATPSRQQENLGALALAPELTPLEIERVTAMGSGVRIHPEQDPATWEEF